MSGAASHGPIPAPPPEIPVALVGCDFRVASAAWRGALVLGADERQALAERLAQAADLRSFAVIDTCNRTEWIIETPHPAWAAELLRSWMQRRFTDVARGGPLPRPYLFLGAAAARHFVRVAVGLESFVPGEREIAGQCMKALQLARTENMGSPLLDELSKAAGRAVRRLERLGRFRDASRGVHALAVDLLAARMDPERRALAGTRIGVAGMGVLGRRLASLLESRGARVVTFNRTLPQGQALPLAELPQALDSLSALVVATGAHAPVIAIPRLASREIPLLVLDLGVPAQVEPSPREGVLRLALDDVLTGSSEAPDARDLALAEELTETAVTEVLLACARRMSARVLAAAQSKRDELRDERLPAILDQHLTDLDAGRRRRLELALRGLMSEQHRVLLAEIERRATSELAGGARASNDSHAGIP